MTTLNEFETIAPDADPVRERTTKDTPRFLAGNAHWALRATLASVFVYHGVLKLTRIEAMAEMLQLSVLVVVLVALAELGGGAFGRTMGDGSRDNISHGSGGGNPLQFPARA